MKFSIWPASSQSHEDVLAISQHAEQTGWDGLWYADHFMPNGPDTSGPMHEAWVTLSALGATVPRLRIGTLVCGNTYRHPAVLAKMAATLDHVTGGRLVLGLGSGWQENEHQQYGIPFSDIPGRLERLDEACQIIKSLFENQTTTLNGKHYQLEEAWLEPKPVQRPLPLLIGGGGEKVTLKIAARYANEWNTWGDVDVLTQKMKVLDQHCRDLGRDPAEIQRSAQALLFMSEDRGFLEKTRAAQMPLPTIIGTPAEVQETVARYDAAGVNELIVPDFTLGPMQQKLATMDLFMDKVVGR